MKAKCTGALMFLGLPLLLSCGGGLSRSGQLTAANQQMMASQFVTLLSQTKPSGAPSLPTNGIPSGVTTSSITPMALDSCITVSPTAAVDADADGLAVERTYTFDCSSLNVGADKYSYKGTMKINDYDDTQKWVRGGYKVIFDSVSTYQLATSGYKGSYSHDGYYEAKASGSTYLMKIDMSSKITTEASTYPATDYTYTSLFNIAMTPESEATPWTKGTISSKGYYKLAGTFLDESPSGGHKATTGSATLEISTTDLIYDSTCTHYYKSGSWFLTDGAGKKLEVRYDCTTYKAYVDGTEITI